MRIDPRCARSTCSPVVSTDPSMSSVHCFASMLPSAARATSTASRSSSGQINKLTRLYGEWFYLKELPLGEVEIRVELSSNAHNPLAHEGKVIDASASVEVTESDPHSHDDGLGHDTGDAGGAGGAGHETTEASSGGTSTTGHDHSGDDGGHH